MLYISLLIPLLNGCIDDKENRRTFTNEPFVCEYDQTKNKTLLRLRDNTLIYTPELENIHIEPGSCGIALHFIMDYDNQTSAKYYEVIDFEYIKIPKYNLKFQEKPETDYQDTLQGIIAMGYIDSILFINAMQKVKKDQEFVSCLIFDPSQTDENEAYILDYATKAITPGTGNETSNNLIPTAFNIAEFVRKYGIEQNKTELKIRIRYQKNKSKNHTPIYATTPILSPLILKK